MTESQVGRHDSFKYRWLIILFGITLLIIAQWRINTPVADTSEPTRLGIWVNHDLHFNIIHIDNLILSLPLFLAGGIFFVLGLRGISLLPSERDFKREPFGRAGYFRAVWPWLLAAGVLFALLLSRVNSTDPPGYQLPALLIVLAIFAAVAAGWDRRRGLDLSLHLQRADLLWISGLLFAGFLVGAYHLQGFPDQLIGDEGNFWTVARDISSGTFTPSIFAPGVYTFPVFSSIIQAWTLRLFGLDMWGWRFGCVFMGILTILPLYLLTREMYSRGVAILASAALITNPYFIDFSRITYISIQSLFFVALTLYWLYMGFHRKSGLYLFLAGAMGGFGFYTFFAARFGIVISLAFIGLLWIGRKIKFHEMITVLALVGAGFALVFTPYLVHGVAVDPAGMSYKVWESVFFNSFNGLQFYPAKELYSVAPPINMNGNVLFYNPGIYAVLIVRGLALTMIAFQRAGIIPIHFIAFPLAGTFGALFYLVGLILAVRSLRQPRNLLLLLWFSANVIGLSALNTVPPRHTHMLALLPALALFIGLGLNAVGAALASLHFKLIKFGTAVLAGLTLLAAGGGLYDFFVRIPPLYPAPVDQVMSWAGLNAEGESLVYLYTDPAQKDFKPYVMQEFRRDVHFESIALQNVLDGKQVLSDRPSVVFYPPEAAEQIEPLLKNQWGASFHRRIFNNDGGLPILTAGMNTPFVFEQDKTFPTILVDSYNRPALWVLLIGLALFFLSVRSIPARWIERIPAPFSRLADWLSSPAGMPPEQVELEPVDWPADTLPDRSLPPEEPVGEPPDWALEGGFPAPPQGGGFDQSLTRMYSKFKPVRGDLGTDYYIKIHLPRFHWPSLPFVRQPASEAGGDSIPVSLPPFKVPLALLLIFSIALALTAQILIEAQLIWPGILAYLLSIWGLMTWGFRNPGWRSIFAFQLRLNQAAEFILAGVIFLAAFCVRFLDLNSPASGLGLDETRWTLQTWYAAILNMDGGGMAPVFYKYFPVDYWIRSFFLRAFGLNFSSARIESAFFSLLAVLLLYLLVRLVTSSSGTALVSALLLGFSFIGLHESHHALNFASPAAWTLAVFAALFWAVRTRGAWQFQACGILLALGLLTSATFYAVFIVALGYLLALALREILAKRTPAMAWIRVLILLAWPTALIYLKFIQPFLTEQAINLFYPLKAYLLPGGQGLLAALQFIAKGFIDQWAAAFTTPLTAEALADGRGPMLNPLLLPFVVIGFAYNWMNIRRPHYAFLPVWYFLQTSIGLSLPDSNWPGTMDASLPIFLIWGSLGLWCALAALRALLEGYRPRTAIFVFGIFLAVLLLNDYRIYKTKMVDPQELLKRRELAELTGSSARDSAFILYPFLPNRNDMVERENDLLLVSMAGAKNLGLGAAEHFKQIDLDHLLSEVWQLRERAGLDIIFDETPAEMADERQRILAVVMNCYPGAETTRRGAFFDVYHFEPGLLRSPACHSDAAPQTIVPRELLSAVSSNPPVFQWNAAGLGADGFVFTLERKRDNLFWIEVEQAFKGENWFTDNSMAEGFGGSGFLYDGWQAGPAAAGQDIPQAGQYRVWVRYYKRLTNDQRNFITIGGQTGEFAENDGPLNEWTWKSAGVFDLAAGPNPLTLTRTYGIDPEYSVFIDSIVLSADLDFHPQDENGIWQNVITTGEIPSKASSYIPPQELGPGEYRWKVRLFEGARLVDSRGQRGIDSDTARFTVP